MSDSIPVDRGTNLHVFVLTDLRERLNPGHAVIDHNRAPSQHPTLPHLLYAAVRTPDGTVHARVILYGHYFDRGRKWIHVKDMDETEGPGYFEGVTRRLLRTLSTTDHQAALRWRANAHEWTVQAAAERKSARNAVGSVIQFATPYTYDTIGTIDTVRVVSRSEFRPVEVAADGTLTDRPLRLAAPKGWTATRYVTVAVR